MFDDSSVVAYFSMEVGLEPAIPTYSGGLGVLAGDTLRAAADLGIPMVGVTLLHRKGYFHQSLDAEGNQSENPADWSPEEHLEPQEARASVSIEGRVVRLRAWRYEVRGVSGHMVPVYFLDSSLEENSPFDRSLTDQLYGGDQRYRLCQEALLGLGGMAMLRALGYLDVQVYHLNEGHSALLTLALLEEHAGEGPVDKITASDIGDIRKRCVFTTHTPVPAGHDKFPMKMVGQVLGEKAAGDISTLRCCLDATLNMTYLALFFSHYINGVSMRHEELAESMFPGYPINSVTNGVHAVTWTTEPFQRLFDEHFPEWRRDNLYLRYAVSIHLGEIMGAHARAKRELLAEVERRAGVKLDPETLTLGYARRATAYKRADLLFSDLERLRTISRGAGPIQVVYAGKAHPRDEGGKALIRHIFEASRALKDSVKVVYLEGYDMALGKLMCGGVDVWLNTPLKPMEASGTSGMKAAMNGVPSLSILDGWWIEGHVEGVTGWSIGEEWESESSPEKEIASLYKKLEEVIVPMFYSDPMAFAAVSRSAIALNGSFFNAQRMMGQYLQNAYL